MVQASGKPTPAETWLPISEAAAKALEVCPIAEQLLWCGLRAGRIRCSFGRLSGHHGSEPTPDQPAFWQGDPRRGHQTQLTPFPWSGDMIRRRVQRRGDRRPFVDHEAFDVTVVWEDVISELPAAAQVAPAKSKQRSTGKPRGRPRGSDTRVLILIEAKRLHTERKTKRAILRSLEDFVKREQERLGSSPHIDTIRHWLAPKTVRKWLADEADAGPPPRLTKPKPVHHRHKSS